MQPLFGRNNIVLLTILVLVSVSGWLSGCSSLCTKRLYLYRETPEKIQPPDVAVLLIADPGLINAVLPEAAVTLPQGPTWAPIYMFQESDAYNLSIQAVDGRLLYQGQCLDTTPSFVAEVKPGTRHLEASMELMGAWGRMKLIDNPKLALVSGKVYFLRPEWSALANKQFRLTVEQLPASYSAELRAKIINWLRQNTTGRSIAD